MPLLWGQNSLQRSENGGKSKSKMSAEKIQQLQLLQQNLQNMQMQKQQYQSQLMELESALKELKSTDKAYKIVGKIMIASSQDELTKDLEEKKELVEVRLKNFTEQEQKLQEKMEKLQQEVMEEMKKKSKK